MQTITKKRARKLLQRILMLGMVVGLSPSILLASDHDDGEIGVKGRNVNLTDVFAFNESWQTGNPADAGNLILIMNICDRALPGRNYTYNNQASYNFHLTRIGDVNAPATGAEDVKISLFFSEPDAFSRQSYRIRFSHDGRTSDVTSSASGEPLVTSLVSDAPINRDISLPDGSVGTSFVGMAEDPFYFDVQQFFRCRAQGFPATCPLKRARPLDFAYDYNVCSAVLRLPISFLGGAGGATVFDVWETIEVPSEVRPTDF